MKDKKRLVFLISLIVIILIVITGIYLFTKDNNGKKKDETNNILKQDKYKIVKKISIDRKEYGNFVSANDKFIVFSNNNVFYLLDSDGNKIKQSNNKIHLYTDSYNNDAYYLLDNVLYDVNHKELYSVSSDLYVEYIYNSFLFTTKAEMTLMINLQNKEEKETELVMGYYNGIIAAYEGGKYIVYLDGWKTYDKFEFRHDGNGVKLSNSNETIYLDSANGKVEPDDYYKIKINNNYYIDYQDCGKVKSLKDDKAISDKCFSSYDKSDINSNFIAFYVERMGTPFLLINDKIKEYSDVIDGQFTDKYYMAYDKNNLNTIYLIDEKGKVHTSDCSFYLSHISSNTYYCSTPFSSRFVEDKKILNDKYKKINCNKYGYCDTEIDNNKGKHALYYGNKQIIEPHYYEILLIDNYIVLTDLYNVDILFLSTDGKQIKDEELKPSLLSIDIDVEKIIKNNNLEVYRDIINDNKELFKKYAYVLENNNKLGEYKKYMYDYFRVIVDQKENMNETLFFQALADLSFQVSDKLQLDSSLGQYNPNENRISLLTSSRNNKETIYHEIMHFIDNKLNDNMNKKIGIVEDKVIKEEEYEKLSIDEKRKINNNIIFETTDIRLFVEGGAENNSGYYFNNMITRSYPLPVAIYRTFEYVFGKKDMDRLFYGDVNFLDLTYNYIDVDMYRDLIKNSNNITYTFMERTDSYEILFDTLITIYKNKYNTDWTKDKKFTLLLSNIIHNIYGDNLSDSMYYEDLNKIKESYNKEILTDLKNNVNRKNTGYKLYEVVPSISIVNDKVYVFLYAGLNYDYKGYLKVEYNVESKEFKILEYIDLLDSTRNKIINK